MPDQEEIDAQQELLKLHRRTLRNYMKRQALQGDAALQTEVANGIHDTREKIARLKGILRGWGQPVEDYPDDGDAPVVGAQELRIFISYKRGGVPDEQVALELYAALHAHYDVFIDQIMPVGVRWAEQIEDKLRRSDFLISLLSEHSIDSEMVLAEIRKAHDFAATSGGKPAILPVRLNYRATFPHPLNFYLDAINWAFWGGPDDTPKLIEDLRRAITGGALPIHDPLAKAGLLESNRATLQAPAHHAQPQQLRLEQPEGTMDAQSAFYVVRESDPLAIETIAQRGVTITIKGPRQMGKSSLLIRTAEAASAAGKRVALLDFQLFDHAALASAETFFPQFCAWLTEELELESQVEAYWSKPLGNVQRCTQYVGRYLLKTLGGPLVLAMDEVESTFEAPFRSDFFSMLRSWHNSRATNQAWKQLDLVLVTSTEPYQLIANLNQSPFNVGQVIELADFTREQVDDLNTRHNTPLAPEGKRQLFALLGGHPYLTRRALYLVTAGRTTAADLFQRAADDRGPFGDHLRYHLFRMHDNPELVQGMRDVLRTNTCTDDTVYWRLRGAGLVRREGRAVLPRNQLYAEYFREHLR